MTIEGMCCDCAHGGPCCDERSNIYELFQDKKDGRPPVTPRAKTYDAHTAEAEYLLGVLWNGLHNADGMDAKVADRVAEIAHEKDRVQHATTPRNDPLTLEQLQEMDGDYVYLVLPSGLGERWAFVQVLSGGRSGTHLLYHDGASSAGFLLDCGAKIYRRKPEA